MTEYVLSYLLQGARTWQQMPVRKQSISIGRGNNNDLALNDPEISRQHAYVRVDARGFWIVDQNSSNGVIVSGQRIPAGHWMALPVGENFTIGTTTLRIDALAVAAERIAPPAATPKPAPPMPRALPAALRSVAAQPPPPVRTQPAPARPARRGILWIGFVVLACLCVVGSGTALWYYAPYLLVASQPTTIGSTAVDNPTVPAGTAIAVEPSPSPTAEIPPTATLAAPQIIAELPVSPGGEVRDEAGAALSLPQGVISPNLQANLTVSQLSGDLTTALAQAYRVESLAYSVSTSETDGAGRPTLRIPAPSAQARLAVLLDGRYLGVLEIAPQDGFFVVEPVLAAPTAESQYPGLITAQSPTQYFVVTSLEGQSQAPVMQTVGYSLRPQGQPAGGSSCVSERLTLNHCWRNEASSVYLFWEDNYPAELKDSIYGSVGAVINTVAEIMKTYQGKGFVSAAISPGRAVDIIIKADLKDPEYSPRTGNLYLPWRFVSGLSNPENRCTVGHELFHWVEDEEYPMNANFWSGAHAWWLETSAEYGTFLENTACIEKNLTGYGNIATNENTLAFQSAPLIWKFGELARYLQAQQLYVSICNNAGPGCALTQAQFVEAINGGTFPLDDGGALARYERASSDAARYLLGAKPLEARTDAFLPAVTQKPNRIYGDFATLLTADAVLNMDVGWMKEQVKKASAYETTIEAQIQKGGEYPLTISNGILNLAGLPGVLKIEAGPPFWAQVDDKDPVLYPGTTPVLFGAISKKMGVGSVRIGAFASDQPQTFKASLKVIELSGDWLGTNSSGVFSTINCGEVEGMAPGQSVDQFAQGDPALAIVMGYGTFVKDPDIADGSYLIWRQGSAAPPQGMIIQATARLLPETVELKYKIEIPKPQQGYFLPLLLPNARANTPFPTQWSSFGAGLGWGSFILAVLFLWVALRRPQVRRTMLLIVTGALAALTLIGCMGQAYGTIEGAYNFTKIEVIDPNAAATSGPTYTYKLTEGVGSLTANLTILLAIDPSSQGVEEPCQIGIDVKTDVLVGPDGIVTAPPLE